MYNASVSRASSSYNTVQTLTDTEAVAQAEFSVLAHASGLERKLARLEAMEGEQGLDVYGGLASRCI